MEKGEDGNWSLTAPEKLGADQSSVSSLVTTLSSLNSDRLIEEKAENLENFGLDSPEMKVLIVGGDGHTTELLIGDETPTGGSYFAKLEGDPRIYTLASYSKTSIDKAPWDLRDKRLLTFDSNTLTRVELNAQKQSLEIGKNNLNEWQIVEPRPLRADGGNVEQLISRLTEAKMESFMSDEDRKDAASKFSSASRVAIAKVTDAAGTQQLEVRKTGDDDYYAASSIVDGVYKITNTVGEGLDKGLDDLRNKKLFDFGWNDPIKIEIRDGDQTAVYDRSDEAWTLAGKEMDSLTVRALIDELRDLSASGFPETGFSEPVFEAKITSNDGARVEKVLISSNGADNYFAIRENEPAVYKMDAADVEALRQAANNVKEHQEPAESE